MSDQPSARDLREQLRNAKKAERAQKGWGARHRLSLAVAAIVMLAGALGGYLFWSSSKPSPEEIDAKNMRAAQACDRALGDFMKALIEVDARLEMSLHYAEYDRIVSDAAVEYGLIDWTELVEQQAACAIRVGEPLKAAHRNHADAEEAWEACEYDDECTDGSELDQELDAELDEFWARATEELSQARQALRDFRPFATKTT